MGARKLSDEDVHSLRVRRVINQEYLPDLAEEFGISLSHASRIVRGEYRAAAGGPLQEEDIYLKARRDMSGINNPNAVLSDEDREIVRKLIRGGATHQAVAEIMGISRGHVSRIAEG